MKFQDIHSKQTDYWVKRSIYFISIILVFAFFITLNGCATGVALKQHDRSSIKSVSILEDVLLPDVMYYQGVRESAFMGLGGIIGAIAAGGGRKKTEDIIKIVMHKSDIDVRKIVKDKFNAQLKESNLFNEVLTSECDDCPNFSLSVFIYGFAQPHGLSYQLKPMLGVEGILTKPDNSILWKKSAYVTNVNRQTPSHTLEEYLKEPELMREAFNAASEIVIGDLVNHIRGDY